MAATNLSSVSPKRDASDPSPLHHSCLPSHTSSTQQCHPSPTANPAATEPERNCHPHCTAGEPLATRVEATTQPRPQELTEDFLTMFKRFSAEIRAGLRPLSSVCVSALPSHSAGASPKAMGGAPATTATLPAKGTQPAEVAFQATASRTVKDTPLEKSAFPEKDTFPNAIPLPAQDLPEAAVALRAKVAPSQFYTRRPATSNPQSHACTSSSSFLVSGAHLQACHGSAPSGPLVAATLVNSPEAPTRRSGSCDNSDNSGNPELTIEKSHCGDALSGAFGRFAMLRDGPAAVPALHASTATRPAFGAGNWTLESDNARLQGVRSAPVPKKRRRVGVEDLRQLEERVQDVRRRMREARSLRLNGAASANGVVSYEEMQPMLEMRKELRREEERLRRARRVAEVTLYGDEQEDGAQEHALVDEQACRRERKRQAEQLRRARMPAAQKEVQNARKRERERERKARLRAAAA